MNHNFWRQQCRHSLELFLSQSLQTETNLRVYQLEQETLEEVGSTEQETKVWQRLWLDWSQDAEEQDELNISRGHSVGKYLSWSCTAQSILLRPCQAIINLPALFLGLAYIFTIYRELPFLNQWKRETGCRNYFMINNLHKLCGRAGIQPCDTCSHMLCWLTYGAQLVEKYLLHLLYKDFTYRLRESMGLEGPRWHGSSWQRGIAESGSSRLSTLMIEICGDLVWDLPCVQQASYLEGGPLMWMLPLYLHVNKKSGPSCSKRR